MTSTPHDDNPTAAGEVRMTRVGMGADPVAESAVPEAEETADGAKEVGAKDAGGGAGATGVLLSEQPVDRGELDRVPSGDDGVERALDALDGTNGQPIQHQIDAAGELHRALQGRLADLRD